MVNEKHIEDSKLLKKENLFELFFCYAWIMLFIYMVIRPIINSGLIIRFIWAPSLFLLFFSSFKKTFTLRFFLQLIIPIAIIVFSVIANIESINYMHILSAFCYISMFMVLRVCADIKLKKITFDLIFYANVALSFIFFIYTFTPIAHRVHTDGEEWVNRYFVFDLDNSNAAAMYIFSFYCVLLINLAYRKHKFPIIILMVLDLYMIYGTNCRSVMLSVILVTLAYVFFCKKRIPTFWLILGIFIPIVFIVFYLALYNALDGERIILLNKSLFSGRENVFMIYLGYIDNWVAFLFGNYTKAALQNAHNIVAAIISSLGIIGLGAFYSYFINLLVVINNKETTSLRTVSLVCIVALFLQASMESSFFLGGFPSIMSVSTFVMLSNYSDYPLKSDEAIAGAQ